MPAHLTRGGEIRGESLPGRDRGTPATPPACHPAHASRYAPQLELAGKAGPADEPWTSWAAD